MPGGRATALLAAVPAVAFGVAAGASGTGACVDQSLSTDGGGIENPDATSFANPDALPGPATCTDVPAANLDAALEETDDAEDGAASDGPTRSPYSWRNARILGGGFVTGIVFSPVARNVIYARTDVGGAYRWSASSASWVPITDWIGATQTNLVGIESVAADPVDPDVVYLAAGEYITSGNGKILRSADQGATWSAHDIGVPMGGNADGRSMGERLAVDPHLPSTLYFASRTGGLRTSTDSGASWSPVSSFPTNGAPTYGLSFVLFDPRSGASGAATKTIYVGATPTPMSSTSILYRSTDAGMTWKAVPNAPTDLYAHHAAMNANGIMYLAVNDKAGPNDIDKGSIWKLDTSSGGWSDVSPPTPGGGYGGVAVDHDASGTVVVTSIDRWPDEIYRTTNGGTTWTALGPLATRDVAGAEWLYWHGSSPSATGWMGDIQIDPFDSAHALYVTGQGLWWSDDVTSADMGDSTHWVFRDEGIEQTVALGIVSPSLGPPLLSAVGDLGGFCHADLDDSPDGGMFDNPIFGNTTSLDFAASHPSLVVRVGTSSSSANTTGHGAYSANGGETWTPFAQEPGGGAAGGSIAVSAGGLTFVWAPQGAAPAYSRDWGDTWSSCTGAPSGVLLAADRVNPTKFYAAAQGGELYVSTDSGATFAPTSTLASQGAPRPVEGREGDLFVALGGGLYHSIDSGHSFTRLDSVQTAAAIGFGRGAGCSDYPVLYLSGGIASSTGLVTGVFRSDDEGTTWHEIDGPKHRFGWIGYISGDPRSYGRVYLGSGGRGILYGDPR